MKIHVWACCLLSLSLLVGCESTPQTQEATSVAAPMPRAPETARRAVNDILIGMTEADLDTHMRVVAADTGTMLFGNTKRRYFKLSDQHQVWVDLTMDRVSTVTAVGFIEPLTPWERLGNGLIVVD